MLPLVSRMVDRFLSRGNGLDAHGDPFGAPLRVEEFAALLGVVRDARAKEAEPPFSAPIPLPGSAPVVPILLQAPTRGRAWVVLAPPYGAFSRPGDLGVYRMHAAVLRQRGFGVAALPLPYHGARAMKGRPSGWGFVRADLAHTARAILASAAEVMLVARWLRETRGAGRVAGLGISLGGAGLGLAASVGAPFDALAFLAAVDNPAAFYATGQNREARRKTLLEAGFDQARIEAAFRPVAPSSHAFPGIPRLWAIPHHDLVVPASAQLAWSQAWRGEAWNLRWEGHGVALGSPRVAWRLADWLAKQSA